MAASTHGLFSVAATGFLFYWTDVLMRSTQRREIVQLAILVSSTGHARGSDAPKLSDTLRTVMSISIIMFTNSLVTFSMDVISGPMRGSSGIGLSLSSLVAGLVVAKTISRILRGENTVQS